MCCGRERPCSRNDFRYQNRLKGFTLLRYARPRGNQTSVRGDDFTDGTVSSGCHVKKKNPAFSSWYRCLDATARTRSARRSFSHEPDCKKIQIRGVFWTQFVFESHHLLPSLYIFQCHNLSNRVFMMFLFCKLDCSASEQPQSQDFFFFFGQISL